MRIDGPIPGENFTSDTKNYAWHRPPEYTDIDKAIDFVGKKLLDPEVADGMLTMIEAGVPIAPLVEMFVTAGIGSGKWTVDFAVLMAGPVSHIMCLLADGYGVKYDLGIDGKTKRPSVHFFEAQKPEKQKEELLQNLNEVVDLDEVKKASTGFVGMASSANVNPAPSMTEGV